MKLTYWPFKNYYKKIWLRSSILGIVQREPIKCGKPNCNCVFGKPHYAHYHYYRDPLTHQRLKRYIPRLEVCKLKQRLQYWKNKYYFWNYMPAKTIAYSKVILDNKRTSLFYKRLHILTQVARTNLSKMTESFGKDTQISFDVDWYHKPYRYILREKGTHAVNSFDLLLKSADMLYKHTMRFRAVHKMNMNIEAN